MQEKIREAEAQFPGQSKKVSDLVSGIHNSGIAVGALASPLVGSMLFEAVGFKWACDVVALALLAFAAIHLLFCDVFRIEREGTITTEESFT